MSILILAEHDNKKIRSSTLNTIAAAKQLKQDIIVLVAGYQCNAVSETLKSVEGITEIRVADHINYQNFLAEALTPLIVNVMKEGKFTHIFAPATTFGKNIMPRVAALMDVAQISDVIEIIDDSTYRRPIYAGNAIETVQSQDPLKVITVRPTAFVAAQATAKTCKITAIDYISDNYLSRFVQTEAHAADRPDLMSAQIVISGGRGLQSKENFDRLTAIADAMGAAIGASRAAVDAGFAPNDLQVGQTGKIVAPKLYIAIGISGAIQHLAGMKESKIIIAINKDVDAPIFKIADYGLVADLHEVLIKLEEWAKNKAAV